MLVLPTINGTKAFGFAESAPADAGERIDGVLQLTPADALVVQSLVERGEPLSYCGPVWAGGAWKSDAFPISVSDVTITPGALVMVRFAKLARAESALAARSCK